MPSNDTSDPSIFPLDSEGLAVRSARGFLATVIAQGAKTLLTAISAVVLSRLLSASDFGLLALIAPVTGLLTLLSNVGLFQAVVQSRDITSKQIATLLWISLAIGFVLSLMFICLAPLLAYIFHNPKITAVTIVLSLTIFLSSAASVQIAILNRVMDFKGIALVETAALSTTTFTSIGFAWAGFGYWGLVYGQVVGGVAMLVLAWSLSPWKPSSFASALPEVRAMLTFGRNLTLSNVALYLNTSVDNMIIGYRLGEHSLGLYDRAWKLGVLPLNQLLAPVSRIALPSLSRLLGDDIKYRRHFKALLEMMMLVSVPGLVAAIISAPVIVPGLLGDRWRELVPVFQWLCIGGILGPVNGAMFWLFTSQGRSKDQVTYTIGAIAINLAAYLVGISWGLEGVARTSAISVYIFQLPLLAYGACKEGPVTRHDVVRTLVLPVLAIAAAGISSLSIWHLMVPSSFVAIVFFFIQAYLASILIVLVTPKGRTMLVDVQRMLSTALAKTPSPPIDRSLMKKVTA